MIIRIAVYFFLFSIFLVVPDTNAQEDPLIDLDNLEVITIDNFERLQPLLTLQAPDDMGHNAENISFNADSTLLAATNLETSLWYWYLETAEAKVLRAATLDWFNSVAFHPTDKHLLLSCNEMWDVETQKILYQLDIFCGAKFDASGDYVVSVTRLYDSRTGEMVQDWMCDLSDACENELTVTTPATSQVPSAPINFWASDMSTDGNLLALIVTLEHRSQVTHFVEILDRDRNWIGQWIFPEPSTGFRAKILFSPDGQWAAYSSFSSNITLIEISKPDSDGIEIDIPAYNYAFLPNSHYILGFRAGAMVIYDVDTAQESKIMLEKACCTLAVNYDGKLIATAGETAVIWGVPKTE